MTNDGQWQDRIIETREGDPLELIRHAHPQNWKHHPESQGDALEAAINEVGMVARPLFNVRTGRFLDGHLRLKRAVSSGQRSIRYDVVDLSEEEERLVLATLDPVIRLAEPDTELYAALAAEIGEDFPDLDLADFWPDGELEEMLAGLDGHAPPEDPGPQIDRAGELRQKWGVEVGQVWQLGEHRVVCGDCTDPAVVEAVMRREKAEMVFTSPPYNTGVSAKLRGNTSIGDNLYRDRYNDNQRQEDYLRLLVGFTNIALIVSDYVFVNLQLLAGNKQAFVDYWHTFNDKFADVAIWDKGRAAPQQAQRVMDSRFEFVLIFSHSASRAIGTRNFRGMVHNVFCGHPQTNNEFADSHAATFPVDFPMYFISNFSNAGEKVLDCFLGTGTTLIACEQLGRRARGIEIEPGYVAVTLERWQQATGRQPQLC